MRYVSLFSGIEAASQAWHPLGWECLAVSEIEPFPCEVLKQRWPHVPNLGDVTKITEEMIAALGRIDLVVFGSPCQDLSVAGKRKGLDGARSGLFFDAMRIVGYARQHGQLRFALWENVPGAFSSNEGRDFAAVVDHLAGLEGTDPPPNGWGTEGCAVGEKAMVEWSTLDAQFAGVAQRRRRVFAVADFGDWSGRPPILLEPESMRGDSAPRRGTREDTAGTTALGVALRGREGGGTAELGDECSGTLRASGGGGGDKTHIRIAEQRPVLTSSTGEVAHCLNAGGMGRIDYETETETMLCVTGDVTHTLKADGFDASEDGTGRGTPIIAFSCKDHGADAPCGWDRCRTHGCDGGCTQGFDILGTPASEVAKHTDVHTPLRARLPGQIENSTVTMITQHMRVRRLTPRECERLQGMADDYTAITVRGKPAADGPRYKALGNSMAVPVMAWIGRQIDFAWGYF